MGLSSGVYFSINALKCGFVKNTPNQILGTHLGTQKRESPYLRGFQGCNCTPKRS